MPATILVIEDHVPLRRSLRGWLESNFPGCCVLEAACVEEAVVFTQTNLPQVAVVDIDLLGTNGFDAVARLNGNIPAVVLTIYEDEIHRVNTGQDVKCVYVLKDKLLTELRPVLTALLSTQAMEQRNGDVR